jgi:hypothetical protein
MQNVIQYIFILKILVHSEKTKDSGLNCSRHFQSKFVLGSLEKLKTHNA